MQQGSNACSYGKYCKVQGANAPPQLNEFNTAGFSNMFHHMCQGAYEAAHPETEDDEPMSTRYFACLLKRAGAMAQQPAATTLADHALRFSPRLAAARVLVVAPIPLVDKDEAEADVRMKPSGRTGVKRAKGEKPAHMTYAQQVGTINHYNSQGEVVSASILLPSAHVQGSYLSS
jgi:hypothetical protein